MSMKEIARRTGLSIATVSHALNDTRGVSQKNKELVLQTAKEIGYKPLLAAQMLRTQKSNIVALVIPSSHPTNDTNSFYFSVLNGAKAALAKQGYDMIVSTYSEEEKNIDFEQLRVMQTRMIDGMLLVPYTRQYDSLSSLLSLEIPVVLVDRTIEGAPLPTVCSDNYSAAEGLVRLLAGAGAKRIAFLGGSMEYSTVYERYQGYTDTLNALSLPVLSELVLTGYRDRDEEGYRAMKLLYQRGADAVFTENSMLMLGVIRYCQQHGIRIPQDFSIAGFDNAPWMQITSPTITAVQQDAYTMGVKAADMLVSLIEKEEVPQQDLLIPTDIVLRQSHNKNI